MRLSAAVYLAILGCRGSAPPPDAQASQPTPPPESEAPVALNADSPIAYPPALFEQKVEGDVTLRLYVDSTGHLVPESTRVAETSGYPALDSAALSGAPSLRFAPAKRHGVPVATAFLQPVEFRQVGTTRTGTVTLPTPPPPPQATPVRPPPPAPRPRPRVTPPPPPADTTRADTTRADTTRARTDSGIPTPPPAPPPSSGSGASTH